MFLLFYRLFNRLLIIVVLTVYYIRCDDDKTIENSTVKSCTVTNVTDMQKQMNSSCGDNEIIYLFIKDSHFHSFPPHIFEYFPKLQSIDVSDAGIEHIDSTTFDTATHLTSLDMNGSNMSTLQSHLFSHVNNLTSFDMANSSIITIQKYAFHGLSNLKQLDLSNNKIVKLDAEMFQPLSLLETIRLTNNKIQVIDRDLFQHNVKLKWAYFSNNEIIIVDPNSFYNCQLILLDLGSNQLRDVDMSTMKHLKNLIVTNNRNMTTLIIPPTVNEIHAENNSIAVIHSEERNELLKLFLCSNRITNLQNLINLNKLQFLDMSNNHIRNIEFSDLNPLSQLKELKLVGNKLSEIKIDDVVTNLPKLKMIELSTVHWSNSYVEQLNSELKNHTIDLIQDRSIISDDDAIPSPNPATPTQTPNADNIGKKLDDIDRRLNDVLNKMVDSKKIDDRFADLHREVEDKMMKSNASNNARYDAIVSTFKAYEVLVIIMFVSCLMFVIYKVIVYSKSLLSGMRYRRTQSHDPIFSEQDL